MKQHAQQSLPYQSHELRVGGHVLRWLDEGPDAPDEQSRVILCVHGNPTWSYYWRRVIERFRATHRVIAVDHLGCGRSDKPPRHEFPYTLAAHRDNLLALIDTLKLERITLLAHDWGGAIGLSAMAERLNRLSRIVLLNTAAFPPPYVPLRIAICRTPLLGTAAIRGGNLFARAAVTMAMSRNRLPPEVAASLLEPYDNWQHRVGVDSFVRDIPMSKRHPTYAQLEALEQSLPRFASVPSLLIWGMQDWCFRESCLRRFEAVWPAATTVEIADAGHYVIEDAPDETLAAMESFLAERIPGTSIVNE